MLEQSDRRVEERTAFRPPLLGVVLFGRDKTACPETGTAFVDVHNASSTGVLVEGDGDFSGDEDCWIQFYDTTASTWRVFSCRPAWVTSMGGNGHLMAGLALGDELEMARVREVLGFSAEDIDFLMRTEIMVNVPREILCKMLNCLRLEHLHRGDTLINQGEDGDSLFVIQKGACRVEIEKGGKRHRVARLHAGDVVGEMAVLTGEPRTADVIASREMSVWRLDRGDFDDIAMVEPDLRMFLTEIVAHRLENSPVVADRTIGKYVIRHKLGKGGWSLVYRGKHGTLGIPVAIKMMRHDMAMRPDFQDSFRKEAHIIAGLRHPSIVQVFDIEEMYRTVFIIMEYMEGYSLKDVLAGEAQMSYQRAASMLRQICTGLKYAHDQGIVHRDVKPANVHVLQDDRIKLLDFGLACDPGTEDMSIAGTPKYAPPEQIDGDPVDHRADIYSTGIMAYEMVVGERPYPEDDLARLMDLHCDENIPDPAESVPDIPGQLREFIITACSRNPSGRFADMGEAISLLEPLCRQREDALRKMTSMFMLYPEESQSALNKLMEEFAAKARELSVDIRTAEISDI